MKELGDGEFDHDWNEIGIADGEKIPKSMFGYLKGKTKFFTRKGRKTLWQDGHRFN